MSGDLMTKLSMHESLPFDEATAPSLVSTGELPQVDQVRDAVTEAYERYRSNSDGAVANYIPALASASPGLFGISVVGARGRSFEIGDVETAFSIQSVSKPFVFALVCEAIGYEAARRRLGVNSTGFPFNSLMAVELNDERTMNPLVNAGAIATTSLVPGDTADEKWERIRDGLSRFAGRELTLSNDVYESESATNMRNQGIAHLLAQLRAALLRPRRGHRRLYPAVLPRRDRPRPRGDGCHAGQRRGESDDRRASHCRGGVPAGAGRDGHCRPVRAVRETGCTRSGCRARAASVAAL